MRAKIYWVRGPLLGLRATALPGFALGTDSSPDWNAALGNDLDRHELAHAALYQHLESHADPPLFFDEGWAESQAHAEFHPADEHYIGLAWQLSHQRQIEDVPRLRELVGPEQYHNHFRRKHIHHRVGAPLVAFLIREYGSERFLELYNTCRQETFDADCQRVLGVGVDELDYLLEGDVSKTLAEANLKYDIKL